MSSKLVGIIPATYTPMCSDHRIDFGTIGPLTDRLVAEGVNGLYVCGSTGEGVSMTVEERKRVAEEFIAAARGRVPVIVHVGHNSLHEARSLAAHAQQAGANFTSALAPSYFSIHDVAILIDCIASIAAGAPELPFYYYHIPSMTNIDVDIIEFLRLAGDRIDNFAGIKYTANTLNEYQSCVAFEGGRFDILYGYDELLLPALAVGARGAVGSTYNIAAPLYRRIIDSFEAGDIEQARVEQLRAVKMIRMLNRYPFHPAVKAVMGMVGTPCGPCRLPLPPLTEMQSRQLGDDLEAIGFFQWVRQPSDTTTR